MRSVRKLELQSCLKKAYKRNAYALMQHIKTKLGFVKSCDLSTCSADPV